MVRGNITFVSVLVRNPADPNPLIKRIEWLLDLVRAELPLVLYVCPFFQELFGKTVYPGLTLVSLDLEATEIFTHIRAAAAAGTTPLQLPEARAAQKDTEFFCALMNTKTELVARATRDGLVRTPFVAFLDASIVKVLRSTTRTLELLKWTTLSSSLDRPLLPGCLPPRRGKAGAPEPPPFEYWNRICWTFCGGFFIVPAGQAMDWHVRCRNALLEWLSAGRLAWEVNLWAWMVETGRADVAWWSADHNDTMLTVPAEFLQN